MIFERAAQAASYAISDTKVSFSDLAEHFPEDKVPFLDRSDVQTSKLSSLQRHWWEKGYVLLEKFIPEALIAEYLDLRKSLNLGKAHFSNFTPYLDHEVIRKITLSEDLQRVLVELMGQNMGLHFVLTAFHSTERGWHQDDYLNPDYVYSNYCAAWISLGETVRDAGPFEFIEGSHKWPCVRRHLVQKQLVGEWASLTESEKGGRGHWAEYAEFFTNDVYIEEIQKRKVEVSTFLAGPGDVLIWHGKLVHRGSAPYNPLLERPSMISHFSGVNSRQDIGTDVRQYGASGCHYWNFPRK